MVAGDTGVEVSLESASGCMLWLFTPDAVAAPVAAACCVLEEASVDVVGVTCELDEVAGLLAPNGSPLLFIVRVVRATVFVEGVGVPRTLGVPDTSDC